MLFEDLAAERKNQVKARETFNQRFCNITKQCVSIYYSLIYFARFGKYKRKFRGGAFLLLHFSIVNFLLLFKETRTAGSGVNICGISVYS
jgi:hypothetical protein